MEVPAGSVNVEVAVRILTSVGDAILGLDVSAPGLDIWYRRAKGAVVHLSLSDLASLTADHSDGGFFEQDDGWYRVDVPDAAFALGVPSVIIGGDLNAGTMVTSPYALTSNSAVGSGGILWEVHVSDGGGNGIPDVASWVTTDIAGTNIVAGTLYTDDFGVVTFMLDAGTYYLWRNSARNRFVNPKTMTVVP